MFKHDDKVMDRQPITVATYNVHGFPWIMTPIKQIVGWITRSCDVIALQEVWCRWPEWSAAFASAGWVFLHPARESHFCTLFGSGLAFAWRSSSWTLRDSRQYPFLAGVGLDVLATKGWFRLDLINRGTGQPLRLINTHLQADIDLVPDYFMKRTGDIRKAQARQLVSVERVSKVPTLLIGDLNTDQDLFEGFQFFPSEAHTDEFKGIDRCGFLIGKEEKEGQGWTVIDWLASKEAEGWSDHLPVLWQLQIPY